MHGFENEADAEGWAGFHQWNICKEGGDITVTGKHGETYRIIDIFENLVAPIKIYSRPVGQGKTWCGGIFRVC